MRKIILPAICLVLLYACSKSGSTLSKAELLTAKPWKIVADSILPGRYLNGQLITDMYSTYKACERDNYYVFSKDGTLEANNGTLKCAPADYQSLKLTWFLQSGETKLSISPDQVFITGLGSLCDIIELNAQEMVLRWYDKDNTGTVTRVHTLTLRH
ncbi:hypothetical protein [Niastella populi]|uniref:Lipocalin-like domain-containing protein n=1 Tax=Niastella populi TaxID=550983 RepID=A0A1V9GB35_9BACT|nr:hypothetical protein [Niastella populi]OQP67678.1 hypothetical protein A4R26_11485 [Niastella populi]